MSKYDYSKVPREKLEAMARVSENITPSSECSKNDVFEFIGVRDNVRAYAYVKTRADYDREIGNIVRGEVSPPFGVNWWEWKVFLDLVYASKSAPEGHE
jgi:hypothetical protein